MLYTGRRNPSAALMMLFVIWVLTPFAVLTAAEFRSRQWSGLTRTALYALMLVVALDSLVIYGHIALGPSRPQPAFWFLVVPPASIVLIAVVLRVAAAVSDGRSGSDVA
jgi:membrane-bound metal-dependent hydrolase YbcI (DUF457 family)